MHKEKTERTFKGMKITELADHERGILDLIEKRPRECSTPNLHGSQQISVEDVTSLFSVINTYSMKAYSDISRHHSMRRKHLWIFSGRNGEKIRDCAPCLRRDICTGKLNYSNKQKRSNEWKWNSSKDTLLQETEREKDQCLSI